MKKFIITLSLALCAPSFAITNSSLVKTCELKAYEKLQSIADSQGCSDIGEVEVSSIDNRKTNPSKYIWYKASAECNYGETIEFTALVQYDAFSKKCL